PETASTGARRDRPIVTDHPSLVAPPASFLTIILTSTIMTAMDVSDFKDEPYLKVLRPLVEAYLAFWRQDSRHIRSMCLTPSQFDVIATLGDTDGMTCSELSTATLVTKGTLTGVLDRMETKGIIRRDDVKGDRRCTKIRLTDKGESLFRKTFAAHASFLRPYFERALTQKEAEQASALLIRIRDSFQQTGKKD
ncbi:MAG TPA: MarR family transcriptional regulator, partial [Nitrospiraceae bacterium]|nr:MarR family transcriptional regulator [Nitrospiraceae bacterium]